MQARAHAGSPIPQSRTNRPLSTRRRQPPTSESEGPPNGFADELFGVPTPDSENQFIAFANDIDPKNPAAKKVEELREWYQSHVEDFNGLDWQRKALLLQDGVGELMQMLVNFGNANAKKDLEMELLKKQIETQQKESSSQSNV